MEVAVTGWMPMALQLYLEEIFMELILLVIMKVLVITYGVLPRLIRVSLMVMYLAMIGIVFLNMNISRAWDCLSAV